jgi:hypothetical protein
MALYTVPTGKTTLTSAATKSLILVNPATVSIRLRAVTISLDGSAAAAGVQFDLVRATTLGSPTGTSTTPIKCDERDGAATSTALTVLTAEPTTYAVIDSIYLQPLGGAIKDWQPFGAEGLVTSLAGQRIGLRYTTASGVTPDCLATFYIEE